MSRISYFVRETLISLRRNVMMTISGIITIAICATVVSSMLLFIKGNDRASSSALRNSEFEIFMKETATKGEVQAVKRALDELKTTTQQIRGYQYLDHQKAFVRMKEVLRKQGAEVPEDLKPSEAPESFIVNPKRANDVEQITRRFETRAGVKQIVSAKKQITIYFKKIAALRAAMLAVAAGLLVASMFLVVMTVRLATYARRREIEVMKLVGASNLFVRVPFLAEGVVQGVVGGSIAFGMTALARNMFTEFAKGSGGISFVLQGFELRSADVIQLGFAALIGSAIVGAISAVIGLWRFLDV